MTALGDILARRIALTGPISIADFMAEALGHPQHGYYATRDPLGAAGDFTTAPEISQMFGELVGLAVAQAWMDQGAARRIKLVELGPGRGTLMADILRATARVPGFAAAVDVHMVETSPVLRERQSALLGDRVTHHDHIATVPDGAPLFLVANEFFDALPIRQFLRDGDGWRERMVGARRGALAFGAADPVPVEALTHRMQDTQDGDLVETSAPAMAIAADIGQRIATDGGAAFIIDYGDWRSQGDTLQALAGHEMIDVLASPGEADLTAHVDFEALALAAHPARCTPLTPQGVWLERLGITPRAQALAANLDGTALETHVAAHRRLTHPAEMGTLFKVMAIHPADTRPPPGFANPDLPA